MGRAYQDPRNGNECWRDWPGSSLLLLSLLMLIACRKDLEPSTAAPVKDFHTFDMVTVVAKGDPLGGHVLLCKHAPSERRTSLIRFIGDDGTLQGAIAFDALPHRIENLDFLPEDLLLTDIEPVADGGILLVGTGLQSDLDDRSHMVLYHLSRTGDLIGQPLRRYIIEHAVEYTVPPTEPTADPDGLPRQRALIAPLNGGIAVAARWETEDASGIRLFWIPTDDVSGTVTSTDLPLGPPTDRLLQFAGDPSTGQVALVVDHATSGGHHQTRIAGFQVSSGDWSAPEECLLPGIDMEPQQLSFTEGAFLLIGHRPLDGFIRPFISRFQTAASASNGLVNVTDEVSAGHPLAAYCGQVSDGSIRLALQEYEPSAAPPWFYGDITSDLILAKLDGTGNVVDRRVIVPGQGLRAIALSGTEGRCRIIGTMHPYLNAGYEHTFYLVPDQ